MGPPALGSACLIPVLLSPILGSAVDTWATVAVAIGTIVAVAYALFRDLVVTARRRPKLELLFDRAGNDQVIFGTAGGFDAAYVRLRVANGPGKDTADDVVVMVTELRLADSEDTRPIHLPLTWSGTSPPLTVSAVHPGSARHIDLLHVDLQGDDEVEAPIQLDLNPNPRAARTSSSPARTRFRSRSAPGTRTRSAT